MKKITLLLVTIVLLLSLSTPVFCEKMSDDEFYAIWVEIFIDENEFEFGENDYFTIEYYCRTKEDEIYSSDVNVLDVIKGDVRIHDKLEHPSLYVKDITFHGSCEELEKAGYAIERDSYGDYICLRIVCGKEIDNILQPEQWIIKDAHHDKYGNPLTTDIIESQGKLETVIDEPETQAQTAEVTTAIETTEDEAFSPSQDNQGATINVDSLIETYTEPANELTENGKKLGIVFGIGAIIIVIGGIVILFLSKFTNIFSKKEDE